MVLVDYSDSSSESDGGDLIKGDRQGSRKRKAEQIEDSEHALSKAKPLPPLPASFHSLYATNVRASTTDDPSLHAGRTRQVPHVVGNWPTHVYLEWYPSQRELAMLDRVLQRLRQMTQTAERSPKSQVHDFLRSELGAQQPLHISLSAPLVLSTEQKESFLDSISTRLNHAHIKPFTTEATKIEWVANHDRTRFFLVLKLSRPEEDELNKLLSMCNSTARQFNLPQLYADSVDASQIQLKTKTQQTMIDRTDAFHISVAWNLDEPGDHAPQSLADSIGDQLQSLKVSFSVLKLKIGNVITDMPFVHGGEDK